MERATDRGVESLPDRALRYVKLYGYTTIDHAPILHQRVADMRAHLRDATLPQIARACGSTTETVEKILSHEPIAAWVESEKLKVAVEELQLDRAITEVRLDGFEEIKKRLPEMKDGDVIKAAALASKVHPDGRTASRSSNTVTVQGEVLHTVRIQEILTRAHRLGYLPEETVTARTLPADDTTPTASAELVGVPHTQSGSPGKLSELLEEDLF